MGVLPEDMERIEGAG